VRKQAADQSINNNSALSGRLVSAEKIMTLLEQHLGATSEIVFHDLTKPYEHTIIDIRHGEITGREVGGCGSNLGLEVMRGFKKNGDCFNYITHTKKGRALRSSTIYLYDQDKIIGAICINTDISDTLRLENMLHAYNRYTLADIENAENREHFVQNVVELLDCFIKDAQEYVGVQAPLMNREEKKKFLSYLDKKGAFLISKSGEHVCKFLGISKYTLYNFLEAIRKEGPTDSIKLENLLLNRRS
jgi:predicted transcriptional regulator YheO